MLMKFFDAAKPEAELQEEGEEDPWEDAQVTNDLTTYWDIDMISSDEEPDEMAIYNQDADLEADNDDDTHSGSESASMRSTRSSSCQPIVLVPRGNQPPGPPTSSMGPPLGPVSRPSTPLRASQRLSMATQEEQPDSRLGS